MDTLAARLREAFLGTETGEAVPFDELKDAVKDRWQRVADAARIRVPFSDAQIQRMGAAALKASFTKNMSWSDIIRAALAAGCLEPCAVPEYDPADVALSTPIIADLHKQLEAARREVDEVRRHISVTMSREHQARREAQEAKQQADEYLRMYELAEAAVAAIAHLNTRPEGLPTAKSLGAIGREKYADLNRRTPEHYDEYHFEYVAKAILTALRPWLRDPVGCDLDVTEQAIRNAWLDGEHVGNTWDAARKVLDLCRSRIRPVYECKECSGLKQRLHHAAVAWRKFRDDEASDALDAALEGE